MKLRTFVTYALCINLFTGLVVTLITALCLRYAKQEASMALNHGGFALTLLCLLAGRSYALQSVRDSLSNKSALRRLISLVVVSASAFPSVVIYYFVITKMGYSYQDIGSDIQGAYVLINVIGFMVFVLASVMAEKLATPIAARR